MMGGRAEWLLRRARLPALLLVLTLVPRTAAPGAAGATRAELGFLARHWHRPLAPQGPSPPRFSAIERSLAPESCGSCHPAQLADWKTTVHSRSMGPGVTGQLVEMQRRDPATVPLCLDCHAPLAEQKPEIDGGSGLRPNPGFDAALERRGLVCAACHVRKWERFGPPRREAVPAGAAPGGPLPHDGATRTSAFTRSAFCASCHQFGPGGLALNGKPLENTYAEWTASPAARRGLQCQDCHMPDRRHLWRGIHDPAMVKSGVEIALATDRPRYRPGQEVAATLTIASTGVGHEFPSYVTPRVVVRAALVDPAGRTVAGSVREAAIGRQVTLDLSRELADTRIPPGGRFTFHYRYALDRPGLRLAVSVTVFPDDFYTRFFESLLSGGAGEGASRIRQALAETRRSPFTIFSREVPLT